MIKFPGAAHYSMTCCECGRDFEANSASQIFCGSVCRNNFSNRRNQRGAILYDLFMSMRWNRKGAKGLWSVMCRLAEEWKADDKEDREGRPSWKDPREFIEKRPYLTGKRGRI